MNRFLMIQSSYDFHQPKTFCFRKPQRYDVKLPLFKNKNKFKNQYLLGLWPLVSTNCHSNSAESASSRNWNYYKLPILCKSTIHKFESCPSRISLPPNTNILILIRFEVLPNQLTLHHGQSMSGMLYAQVELHLPLVQTNVMTQHLR